MAEKTGSELATVDDQAMSAADATSFNWVGLNPRQMSGVAKVMALSGMFQDIGKDQAKAYVKILAGQEMGIAPFQAMSDISIISGKAAPGGNIHASKVKASGKYDYRVKRWEAEGAEIEFFEIGPGGKKESLGISSFTKDDAIAANLLNNPSYKKYPRNMYFNRAMTNGVRTLCPDVLNGIAAYTPEELGAEVDQDGNVLKLPQNRKVIDDTPEPAPVATTAAPKPSKADSAQEAEVVDDPPKPKPAKSIIQEIGEELASKGFDKASDRQNLALMMAGVERASDASIEAWGEVLENIKAMNSDELASMLEPDEDDVEVNDNEVVVNPTDEELADPGASIPEGPAPAAAPAEDAAPVQKPGFELPQFTRGSSDLPKPEMRKLTGELFDRLGLKTKVAQQNFCKTAIDKKTPASFDDFEKLLEIMANEINAGAGEGDANG